MRSAQRILFRRTEPYLHSGLRITQIRVPMKFLECVLDLGGFSLGRRAAAPRQEAGRTMAGVNFHSGFSSSFQKDVLCPLQGLFSSSPNDRLILHLFPPVMLFSDMVRE